MNKKYLKSKDTLSKYIKIYLLSILPLIVYGIYKNGFLVYQNGLIPFIEVFKPIVFILLPIIVILAINYIRDKKLIIKYDDLSIILINLFIPVNVNIFMYLTFCLLLITICKIIFNKKYFDYTIGIYLLYMLILYLTNNYNFANVSEELSFYKFNIVDIMLGRSVSGVFASSLFLGMLSFIILYQNKIYKKNITIISISLYTILVVIFSFFKISDFFNLSGILLAVMYLGAHTIYTPKSSKWLMLYSILLGLSTFIFSIVLDYYVGVFIGILFSQIIFIKKRG